MTTLWFWSMTPSRRRASHFGGALPSTPREVRHGARVRKADTLARTGTIGWRPCTREHERADVAVRIAPAGGPGRGAGPSASALAGEHPWLHALRERLPQSIEPGKGRVGAIDETPV